MKQLLEDYKRRLSAIQKLIDDLPSNCPDNPNYIRYKIKASCYRTFILELESEISETTSDWLNEKIAEYNDNPEETLEDMLVATTDIIEQYNNSPNSAAAKGLLDSCVEHNNIFFKKTGIKE